MKKTKKTCVLRSLLYSWKDTVIYLGTRWRLSLSYCSALEHHPGSTRHPYDESPNPRISTRPIYPRENTVTGGRTGTLRCTINITCTYFKRQTVALLSHAPYETSFFLQEHNSTTPHEYCCREDLWCRGLGGGCASGFSCTPLCVYCLSFITLIVRGDVTICCSFSFSSIISRIRYEHYRRHE